MGLYKSNSVQWPILQSTTETKHKSGLLSVSGQFISPGNISAMPTKLPSSIGDISNLYPPPTASKRDGWNTYNATGYGLWSTQPEIIKSTVMIQVACSAGVSFYGKESVLQTYIRVAGQAGTVRKIVPSNTDLSVDVLPDPPSLGLIGKQTWSVNEVFFLSPTYYTGTFSSLSPTLETRVQSVRSTNFGTVTEIEVTYELFARLDFGDFTTESVPTL